MMRAHATLGKSPIVLYKKLQLGIHGPDSFVVLKRLNEKIEAKQKEEAYVQKSEQQDHLTRAVRDFRSGVENHLQRNHQTNSQRFRNEFQAELESLVQAFRRNTDGLHQILEQAKEELERLKSSASTTLEEKIRALIETEQPDSGMKFYKGGQFIPGGGRAPAGGCYMSPSVASSSRSSSSRSSSSGKGKCYKGGQFTPGGGRAPKGGCWK